MTKILTKKQAIEYLEMDDKTFENYYQNAEEFPCLEREAGGRYYFDKDCLDKWVKDYKWRTIELDMDDYLLCLDFALAQHFRGYVLSDWGTARQREFGQKVTNWVKGQLAEVAVKKFFKNEFAVDVELDFEIHKEIVPQDIISVMEKGVLRAPKIGVGIKSSKPKSAYLVLGENEVTLADRKSDVYIFCRPDIPDDHLLRLTREQIIEAVKDKPLFPTYKNQIPVFESMPCEIAGYCWPEELERATNIPGQDFDGIRFVKKTGNLRRTKEDFEDLLRKL